MRKVLLLLQHQIKRIMRKTAWRILFALGLVATLGCFYYAFAVHADPIMMMSQTVFGQAILTLSFMMLGIELPREDRSEHINDMVAAYSAQPSLFPLINILIIIFGAAVITTIVCLGCAIPLILDMAPAPWVWQTVLLIILYFFLPCVAMGIWGLLVSHLLTGKNVYLVAVILWILTSSLSVYYTSPLTASSEFWRLLLGICNMGFHNYQMYQNVVTGARIELPRWIVRGAILLFLAGLYIFSYKKTWASSKTQKKYSRICIYFVTITGIAAFSYITTYYSTFYIQFADDSYTRAITSEAGMEYVADMPVSLTDWPVEKNITLVKTDINLSTSTQGITAEVSIHSILNENAESQSFTLFSGLTVDGVWIDGNQVKFERSHDGILVYFPVPKHAGDTLTFTFRYHGYGLPSYPVNEATVQLSSDSPWFPWPGIKTASENEISNYSMTEVFFIEDWQQGDPVDYTLTYSGPGNLYTNLNKIGSSYTGVSDHGVSLFSGMIHKRDNGIDVYYPIALYHKESIISGAVLASFSMVLEYGEMMEVPILPTKPTSVVVVQMRYPMWGNIIFSPNELYSRGSEWEIHMRNESSSVLNTYSLYNSAVEYQQSEAIKALIVIPYLLNPSSGYPLNAPAQSTHCFADLMAMSMLAETWDSQTLYNFAEQFKDTYLGEDGPDISDQMDAILLQMNSGSRFDNKLKEIYHCLLREQNIVPAEMIAILGS